MTERAFSSHAFEKTIYKTKFYYKAKETINLKNASIAVIS